MTDADLRELERRFRASGSPEDEAAWRGALSRAGPRDKNSGMRVVRHLSEIPPDCFGVTAVDPGTGRLLDSKGKWADEGEGHLVVFLTLGGAEEYCQAQVVASPLFEWSVVDSAGNGLGVFFDREASANSGEVHDYRPPPTDRLEANGRLRAWLLFVVFISLFGICVLALLA